MNTPRDNQPDMRLADPIIPDLSLGDFAWCFGIVATGANAGVGYAAGVLGVYLAQRAIRQHPAVKAYLASTYQRVAGALPGATVETQMRAEFPAAPVPPVQPTYPAPAPAQVAARVGGRALVTPVGLAATIVTSEADQQLARGTALLRRPLYNNDATCAWGCVILAAMPRWGKTQVQIARIVEDIAQGHRVVWMSSHLTLYHPTDQPTDLRPVAHLFEQIYDYNKILETLNHLAGPMLKERLDLYRQGRPVGQTIALHIGEWPALVAEFGEKVAAPVRRLLREAPKAGIIISTLDAQDGQVQTLMLGSGLRQNFWNKLLGGVDKYSWEALTDQGETYQKPPSRTWHAAGIGLVRFPLPDAATIAALAGEPEVAAPVTDTTRRLAPTAQPAPVADDPMAAWEAELFRSAPAEPSEVQALRFAAGRGKLTKGMALALFGGDEAAAFRALVGIDMSRSDIAALWKERKADVLERIRLAAGGTTEPEE